MAQIEDRRIRRTKRLLRQALAELMQEKDFKDITVTDLVQRADINRGTFYMHYKDVYDLREQIENEMIEACSIFIEETESAARTDSLHLVLTRATDYLLENREIVCGLLRMTGEENFGAKMVTIIEKYHNSGHEDTKLAGQYVARFVGAGAVAVMQKWLLSDGGDLSQKEVVHLLDDLLRRILPAYSGPAQP